MAVHDVYLRKVLIENQKFSEFLFLRFLLMAAFPQGDRKIAKNYTIDYSRILKFSNTNGEKTPPLGRL